MRSIQYVFVWCFLVSCVTKSDPKIVGKDEWSRTIEAVSNPEVISAVRAMDWDKVVKVCHSALLENPGNLNLTKVLMVALERTGNWTKAQYFAYEILKKGPSSVAKNMLGIILVKNSESLSDHRKALKMFSEAFLDDPQDCAAGFNHAELNLELGAASQAVVTHREVLARCPHFIPSKLGLGVALRRMGALTESQKIFESLVSSGHLSDQVRFQLALSYYNTPEHKNKFISLLDQVVKESQDFDIIEKSREILAEVKK